MSGRPTSSPIKVDEIELNRGTFGQSLALVSGFVLFGVCSWVLSFDSNLELLILYLNFDLLKVSW